MATPSPATSSPDKYGLSRIAPGIWIVKGESKRPIGNKDPTLIFLFGWSGLLPCARRHKTDQVPVPVDAKIAHLAKFSAGYKTLFHYSDQVVVASKADIWLLPKVILKSRLQPIVDLCKSLGVTGVPPKEHRILMHALSNGGTAQLNYLSQILPKAQANAKRIPSAVILDSAPGGDDLASALHVFSTTISNPLLRYPFIGLLIVVHTITFLLGLVPWSLHDILRAAAVKTEWMPWTGRHTPYLYIYSKDDKSVPYRHIQAHTELSESKGQDVTRLVFESSGHVSHMRSDPVRYWAAVQSIWSKAVSAVPSANGVAQ